MAALKLTSVGVRDFDAMTLDQFVGLLGKLDTLDMVRSDNEQVRNVVGLDQLQRELAVAKAAGVKGGIP